MGAGAPGDRSIGFGPSMVTRTPTGRVVRRVTQRGRTRASSQNWWMSVVALGAAVALVGWAWVLLQEGDGAPAPVAPCEDHETDAPRLMGRGAPGAEQGRDPAEGPAGPPSEVPPGAGTAPVTIEGVVLDGASRQPISGAAVFVDDEISSERPTSLPLLDLSEPARVLAAHPDHVVIGQGRPTRGALTSADGTFSFVAPTRPTFLVAFSAKHEARIIAVGAAADRLVVRLNRASRLEGTVVSAQGRALPGVRVHCRPDRASEAGVFGRSFVTDAAGAFVLEGLAPVSYDLRGVLRGDRTRSVRVHVPPDATARASLDLGPAVEVRVTVRAVVDLAPERAQLTWSQAAQETLQWSTALGGPVAAGTDPRAVAVFAPLSTVLPVEDLSVPVALELHALGYESLKRIPSPAEIALGYVEWDVTLEPAADASRLVLRLMGADGLQLFASEHEIRVRIINRPDSHFYVGRRREQDLVFPLLIPGHYRIGVQVAGQGEAVVDVEIGEGESRHMDVRLGPP